jgi:hypothetical protein
MQDHSVVSGVVPWLERLASKIGVSEHVLMALVVLAAGWSVAWLLGLFARRLWLRLRRSLSAATGDTAGDLGDRRRAGVALGRTVFWTVFFAFTMAATEVLGLRVVTTWLGSVVTYLPRLLVAVLIVFAGVTLGKVSRRTVARAAASAHLAHADYLGRLTQVVVLLASGLVGIEQLGIEVRFVTTAILVLAASLMGGAALAFGLGSRTVVENILASYYIRKLYQVGHVVRIGNAEGRIVRMTPTAVVVQSKDGETAVPARAFLETVSTRLAREE